MKLNTEITESAENTEEGLKSNLERLTGRNRCNEESAMFRLTNSYSVPLCLCGKSSDYCVCEAALVVAGGRIVRKRLQ